MHPTNQLTAPSLIRLLSQLRQGISQIEVGGTSIEAESLLIEAQLTFGLEDDVTALISQVSRLLTQAQTESPTLGVALLILRGRLWAQQGAWETAQDDFKSAISQAKRPLLQAQAYFYYGKSLLERINQGDKKVGLRSRAYGMLAHAAELYQQAHAVLDYAKVNALLTQARSRQ